MTAALIIIALILLNGLFVAAEFAIVGTSKAAIERRVLEGHRAARSISRILHNPRLQDRYFATAQLGVTLASLGLGMYGERTLAEVLEKLLAASGGPHWLAAHALAGVIAVAVLTYFHIVIGEMVPKSLALQHAEKTGLWIIRPMLWCKLALYPLVIILNALGNMILRLFRVKRQLTASHYLSPEELQYIVRESQAEGMLRTEAGNVLRDLLEFGKLTAGQVMVPRVHIVGMPADATTSDLKAIVRASRHSRYPVYKGDLDHILGLVHIKDLLRLMLQGRSLMPANLRAIPYVPKTSRLDSVLTAMRRNRTHLAIVMDEYGGTAGLLTIEDLFEEVVGTIEESPTKLPEVYRDSEERLHVSGMMRLDEVGEQIGLELINDEVVTVSGLVLMLLDRKPQLGDVVTYGQVQFEVVAVKGYGVGECIVTPLSAQTNI